MSAMTDGNQFQPGNVSRLAATEKNCWMSGRFWQRVMGRTGCCTFWKVNNEWRSLLRLHKCDCNLGMGSPFPPQLGFSSATCSVVQCSGSTTFWWLFPCHWRASSACPCPQQLQDPSSWTFLLRPALWPCKAFNICLASTDYLLILQGPVVLGTLQSAILKTRPTQVNCFCKGHDQSFLRYLLITGMALPLDVQYPT